MKDYNWLHRVHQMFNNKKHQKPVSNTPKGYLPISLFLIAGKFNNQEIDKILDYGEEFIKELQC